MFTIEDLELDYYRYTGVTDLSLTLDDAKNTAYKLALGGDEELDKLSTVDLEKMVLLQNLGLTETDLTVDDLWYELLKSYDSDLTVADLKYKLYSGVI